MKLKRLTSFAVVAAIAIVATNNSRAIDTAIVWDGDTSTNWSDGANWVGGVVPPADDHAKITGTFANQPTLTGPVSVGGVWINGLGQELAAVSNDNMLSLGGNTINGISNVAVLFDNTFGFNATIANKVSITSNNLVIRKDTDSNLTFTATNTSVASPGINVNGNTLTFSNNGGGEIVTGSIGGTGGVTINSAGTGVVRGNSNNTSFSGQMTIARGIFSTAAVNNEAANGRLGNSTLPVIMGSDGFAGTLQFIGTAAVSSTKKFTIATNGTGVFDTQPTGNFALTLSGVIDGSGAVEVRGTAGSLILSGANTYSGGTKLVSGTLSLGRNTDNPITNGPIGTGTLTLEGGTLTANATRTVGNAIVTNGSVVINAPVAFTLTGSLTSTNSSDVIDVGSGTNALNINGDISGYHGTFTRSSTDGTLNFGSNDVDGSHARFVMTGATSGVSRYLRFGDSATGTTSSIKMGELSGTGIVAPVAGGVSPLNMHIGYLNTDAEFAGGILGRATQELNLTKVGTGALTLSGPNSYGGNLSPGTTTISSGTLIAGRTAVSTLVNNTAGTGNMGEDFLTTTALANHGLQIGDEVTFQGGPTGNLAAVTTYYVVGIPTPDRFQVSATPGGAPIVLSATQPAALTIAELGAFGSGSTAVVMGDANTGSNNVALLTGGPFTIERAVNVTGNGSGTATIGGNTNDNSAFTGAISLGKSTKVTSVATGGNLLTISGNISGPGFAIEKVGFGAAAFAGANTYTGATTISEGTLLVNGSHTGGGQYFVTSGATLGGTGSTASGVLVNAGGTLAPGASVGTFTVGDADIDGKLSVEYNGDTSTIDKLIVAGSLDISSAQVDFDNLGSAALSGTPYIFATYGSLVGTAFNSVIDLPAGYSINYAYLGNQIALTTGAVPHAGDFDSDGDVDGADFVAWQTNFPTATGATLEDGDADGDGDVDGADFVVWQTNFPFTPGPGASPVPEPGAIALAGFAAAALAVGVRRRSKSSV
jgi:autotransporter-associated beta strand protein